MKNEIEQYHKLLNSHDIFDEINYRRNKISYGFVSYINHIVACYYSENYSVMIAFFWRAKKYLYSENKKFLDQKYVDYTNEYLNLIQRFIFSLNDDDLIYRFKNYPGARDLYKNEE